MVRRSTLLMWVVVGAGCLGRSFPIPPPQNVVQSVTECPPAQCPGGGVILRLSGVATAGAQVFAQDVSGPMDPSGQILPAASGRVTPEGNWQLTLGPQLDSMGVVRAVQRGHLIDLFQVNDRGEASNTVTVLVR